MDLNQQLPKVGKWTDLLTNSKNKCRLTLLLADLFLTKSKKMGRTYMLLKEVDAIIQQSQHPIILWKFQI